ncbi:unnamed protein product [Oncorhynchus mykiss]|uniref:SAM domain-containing protein n=4 Tax=Oncorhynchus TaxID=8016 RepID=A0A060Z8U1_ONCMY|nr:unnamed protein product [Oncorhynchus mykiss]
MAEPLYSQPYSPTALQPYSPTSPSSSLGRGESFDMGRFKESRTHQMDEVNDELLKRITTNKSNPPGRNFRVERPSDSSSSPPLTLDSSPPQVTAWLNAKGFSKP